MTWKFSAARFKISLVLIAIVAIPVSCHVEKLKTQQAFLQQTSVLNAQALTEASPEQIVILNGRISPDTSLVAAGMVTACEERYYSDSDSSGWENEEDLPNEIQLKLPDLSASVDIERACPYGKFETIYDPGNPNRRWRGYLPGSELTVVGSIEKLKPLTVLASEHYGGSVQQYIHSKKSSQFGMKVLMGFVIFGSLLIGFWPRPV